ncbi:hypothetical protein FPQ18DRAFT_335881 [Pyronema domesticum]|uniref:DUF2423 domain-containing protein n=1 Tax=Pyronema omphalodes (strain CBS 100304) TaxID=1076935 RepID=U4LSL4_PYROM|nr:hypothetical protein FPQ18DRAFT_335881 [Pyronema domesticum]CCX34614.1 Similar to predicted protein [Aspergillus terreus NIH2624]; acc. no. XP_001214828 [Pyronema omphalodes CBS 100304]
MAKSCRASVSKRNSVVRRDTIHKPVEDERLKRLSEKLLAIAEAKLPTETTNPSKMEVDEEKKDDTIPTAVKRAQKGAVRRARHARNVVVFPSLKKNHLKKKGAKKSGKGNKN